MGERVNVGDAELWAERSGEGPDVILLVGLGDVAEAWQAQLDGLADRYRLTALDNRGAGRSSAPNDGLSAATMADDAAAALGALGVERAHVAGFSMGSAIAQELAIRNPALVRSLVLVGTYARPDALWQAQLEFWRWLAAAAPSERAFYEAFFTWVYTPRAHADGTVNAIVEEAMAFPHQQPLEYFQAQVDACMNHDTEGRLSEITVPTLVLSGELDIVLPPRCGRAVAAQIPGARFEVFEGEAHQPFQEIPDEFNACVDEFWREVEAQP
jgi:pimeloyl-ACP methyl ester carboxylesterase